MSLIAIKDVKNSIKFNSGEDIILHNYNSKYLRVFLSNVRPKIKKFKHIYLFYFDLNYRFLQLNENMDKIIVIFKSGKKRFFFETCVPVKTDRNGRLFMSLKLTKIKPAEEKMDMLREVENLFDIESDKNEKILKEEKNG